MDFKIAVLAGDGIGPEISVQGVDVMNAVCEKFGHKVSYKYAICGADAIDKVGDPFPEATYEICKDADAVLFSAVGDPKFDNNPTAKVRPEQGLLAMRKKLGLFANIRPVQTFKCLVHKSPLRAELVENADFICIRELTGGMYFGEKYQDNDKAYDTNMYTRPEIERILKVGFEYAMKRRKLTNYAVTIPPGGRTDAFVQTVITWSFEDKVFRTRGLDADQTEAAIKATLKMLNIIESEYENID